jgi:bla regulator protein blaR1
MSLVTDIGPFIANHLWQSTAFAAVCGIASLVLRRNPARVRYGLWLTTSLKFLIPFSLLVSLGGLLPATRHFPIRSQAAVYSALDTASGPFRTSPAVTSSLESANSHSPRGAARLLPRTLFFLWALGSVLVLLVWYRRWRQLSASLHQAGFLTAGREVEILRRLEDKAMQNYSLPIKRTSGMMEPGIFGVFRPVMLWPEGLSEQLTDAQTEAILAHELAHVRRRDNLAALLHMLVEAIFWFHPMVWWIESRIVEEREHACDEAAVLQVGNSDVYAESLLKASRFCLESPLTYVPGIAGGNLRRRILRVTGSRLLQKLDFKRHALLWFVGFLSLAVPVLMGAAHAPQNSPTGSGPKDEQTQLGASADSDKTTERFEVVSIRPSRPDEDSGGGSLLPDGIREKGTVLSILVKGAYHIESGKQLVGFPAGLDSQHYDIEARMNEQTAAKWRTLPTKQRYTELEPMEKAILADRCQFKAHYENKEQPIYELVIAKGGLKMTRSAADEGSNVHDLDRTRTVGNAMKGNEIVNLIPVFDRVIVDKTGLGDEKYDFDLQWSTGDEQPDDPAAARPTLFKAIEEQLGLKLVPAKGAVRSLVVDHIERPSPN